MMNQQPDKFFRDKLRDYQQPVSPAAWDRVSQKLQRKNSRGVVFKIAAAVLLLATATLLFYPPSLKRPAVSSDRTSVKPPESPKPSDRATTEPLRNDVIPDDAAPDKQPVARAKRAPVPGSRTESTPVAPLIALPGEINEKEIVAETIQNNEAIAADASPLQAGRMTIVFTRDEVNQKYLTVNSEPEATIAGEQSSGLKKLLDKAHDLKYKQDLMGNLRQKKNEILAINFRNENHGPNNE